MHFHKAPYGILQTDLLLPPINLFSSLYWAIAGTKWLTFEFIDDYGEWWKKKYHQKIPLTDTDKTSAFKLYVEEPL